MIATKTFKFAGMIKGIKTSSSTFEFLKLDQWFRSYDPFRKNPDPETQNQQ